MSFLEFRMLFGRALIKTQLILAFTIVTETFMLIMLAWSKSENIPTAKHSKLTEGRLIFSLDKACVIFVSEIKHQYCSSNQD